METIRQTIEVTQDRKVEITLPDSINPGMVEVVVVLQPLSETGPVEKKKLPDLFGFLPKRVDPVTFQRTLRDEWNR